MYEKYLEASVPGVYYCPSVSKSVPSWISDALDLVKAGLVARLDCCCDLDSRLTVSAPLHSYQRNFKNKSQIVSLVFTPPYTTALYFHMSFECSCQRIQLIFAVTCLHN